MGLAIYNDTSRAAVSSPVTQVSVREQLERASPNDAKKLIDGLTANQLQALGTDVQQLSVSDRDKLVNDFAGKLDAGQLLKIEPAFGRESVANAVDSFSNHATRSEYQRLTSTGTVTRTGNHVAIETGNQRDIVKVNRDTGNDDLLVTVNGTLHRFRAAETQHVTIKTHGGNDEITVQGDVKTDFNIQAGRGDDIIKAGAGNDEIDGGDGNDYIEGNLGNDRIKGGDGADTIYAGDGDDIVDGGAGNDYIDGYHGNDEISGGDGDDVISGGKGRDTLRGQGGNDVIYTGADTDIVEDYDGTNTIYYQADDKLAVNDATRNNRSNAIVEPVNIPSNFDIRGSSEFQKRVRADIETLGASPAGRQMLEAINKHAPLWGIFGGKTVRVDETPPIPTSGSRTLSRLDQGGGSHVFYDPAWQPQNHGRVPPIAHFFHELAHVNAHQNGRSAEGTFQLPGHPDNGVHNSERQAVGLPFDHDNNPATPAILDPRQPQALTENALRAEMGLPKRDTYN